MKTIRHIFLSYFHQHVFGTMAILITIMLFLVAHIVLFSQQTNSPDQTLAPLQLFFFAVIGFSYDTGIHLKRLVKSNAAALLPHYRSKQLIAVGLLMSTFILWPALLLSLHGFPFPVTLTLLLFSAVFIISLLFRYGDNILSLLIILWVLRIVYEILGLPVHITVFNFLANVNQIQLIIFLIITAIILFYFFLRYYLNISVLQFEGESGDDTDPLAKDHDRAGPYIITFAQKMMTQAKKNIPQKAGSILPLHSFESKWLLFKMFHIYDNRNNVCTFRDIRVGKVIRHV